MKNLKKKLSICLSTCMLLSGSLSAFASEPIGNISMTENTTYTYEDVEGNVYTTTDMELLADGWNPANLNGEPVELYADFPMSIESHMNNKAELSMNLLYLRTIGANDSVTLRIAERENGTVFMEEALTAENDLIFIPSIPLGKVYNITVTHGNQAYSAVIETKYDSVSLPGNISLTGTQNPTDRKVKITEARTEENAGEELEDYLIPASELPELYQDLSADKLYIIQTSGISGEQYDISKAFFSKDSSMQDLGFFVPVHIYYTEESYLQKVNTSVPLSVETSSYSSFAGEDTWTIDDLNEIAVTYNWYHDVFLTCYQDTTPRYTVFKIQARETFNSYTFRSLGNIDVDYSYWIYDPEYDDLSYHFTSNSIAEGNFTFTSGIAEGCYIYVMFYFAQTGTSAFSFKRNDVTDDEPNSLYELSNPPTGTDPSYVAYNTTLSRNFNYIGDVDIYRLERIESYGMQLYAMQIRNTNPSAVGVYTRFLVDQGADGIYENTDYEMRISPSEWIYTQEFRLNSATHKFFVEVYPSTSRRTGTYQVAFLKPDCPDEYEPNNTQSTAITLPSDDGYLEMVTLHYGDIDYFKFNTGAGGADAYIRVFKTDGEDLYNLSLIGNGTTITGTPNATNARNTVDVSDLPANTDYYIKVSSPSTSAYCPGATYELTFEITRHEAPIVYTATLGGNVNLTVGEEDTLTDLSALFTPIMEQLTCYENGIAIADATAQADVKLYYMNGTTKTELTTAIVNNLTAGNYAITVEYQNVAATGGTVTLNVEAPVVGTIIDLNTVTLPPVVANTWDWAACALMSANSRRLREGQSVSTITYQMAIAHVKAGGNLSERGTIENTASAANYIYTNGANAASFNFYQNTISQDTAPAYFLSELQQGKAVILLMTSKTTPSNLSLARYVLLKGINTGTNQYKIADPVLGTESWVDESTVFDGYNNNSDLEFSNMVVEFI